MAQFAGWKVFGTVKT